MSHLSMRQPLASIFGLLVILAGLVVPGAGYGQSTERFAFEVAGSRLVGRLDRPAQRPASSTIIIIQRIGSINRLFSQSGKYRA